jgi:hypothetical protein
MPNTRRAIRAILAQPAARKRLLVGACVAIQAREGIETTEAQMGAAYDRVQQEKVARWGAQACARCGYDRPACTCLGGYVAPRQTRLPHDRPMASPGLTSYRCKGRYGWIMIGARDAEGAMREARRSTDNPRREDLEVWDGARYVPAPEG